jgi:hypothetical protein
VVRTLVPVLNVGTVGKGRRMGCVQTSVPLHDCTTRAGDYAFERLELAIPACAEGIKEDTRRTRRIAVVRFMLRTTINVAFPLQLSFEFFCFPFDHTAHSPPPFHQLYE